jgi:hypothetical protein
MIVSTRARHTRHRSATHRAHGRDTPSVWARHTGRGLEVVGVACADQA